MAPLERFDAVIVGSGFGGSISALRLSEAGRSVLLLERGQRYTPGTFPRDVRDVDRLLWRYPRVPAARGLYDLRFFSGLGAVVASGLGGGSLIYANVHIRPDSDVFEDPRWPPSFNRKSLDPYYDRVASMLGVAPLPDAIRLAKRDAFKEAARRTGRSVFDPDEAVAWTQPSSPERHSCQLCAECEFGCQFGAKNTLDLTYLPAAESLGARIETDTHVTHVAPASGGYAVFYKDTVTGASGFVEGRRVVLAAGTLGTNEILLRSRDLHRTLPGISPRLGHGYSANGDFLGSIQNAKDALVPWEGPDVTSVIRYTDSAPAFTMAAPSFNRPVMEVLASMGQGGGRWLIPIAPLLWRFMDHLLPWAFRSGWLSRPVARSRPGAGPATQMTNLFAIGRDAANGLLRLRGERLDVVWDYARQNRELIARMDAAMREVADVYGGTYAPLITWLVFSRIITVHSLGGCDLSESPESGVVSERGEVHGYPGLFVADGSVIPTAIGFHPAMTIAAVCERIAEGVAAS